MPNQSIWMRYQIWKKKIWREKMMPQLRPPSPQSEPFDFLKCIHLIHVFTAL